MSFKEIDLGGISLKKVTWEEGQKRRVKQGNQGRASGRENRKPKCPEEEPSLGWFRNKRSPCQVGNSRDEVRDVRWEVPSHCHGEDVPSCSSGCCVMHRQKEGKELKQGPVRRITSLNEG